ncbi:MAG: nucleoside phosphorylase [Deltaproteobacteria bacterium]|nr:nucleoside phosphorylase [Deltaproteobacteria bacterium]
MSVEEVKSAAEPYREGDRQLHLDLAPGEFPRYVMTGAHPERIPKMASKWDKIEDFGRPLNIRGGFVVRRGEFRGVKVGAVNTGLYSSSQVVIEELARIGVDTIIRTGTTAALRSDIRCGELIINHSSVRLDGTSDQYVMTGYPADAHYEATIALVQACERLGIKYHLGIGCSTVGFYVPQARPGFKGYFPSRNQNLISDLQQAQVLNFEGQAATLFTLANIYGLRAGAIFAVVANRVQNVFHPWEGEEEAIAAGLEAITILAEWDRLKEEKQKDLFYPDLCARQFDAQGLEKN